MHKKFIQIAAVLGAVTVILGAFGAHALKQILPATALATFETAVRYQFYHVFAILLTGILYKEYMNKFVQNAGHLFIIGIVLFSGSLYLLTYLEATETIGYRGVGAITPIGGLCFISGWISLAIGIKSR